MVFTIVTVIFLPMSFIAALFAIPLQDFESSNGTPSLPFTYVAKFIFGVGLAISIPLIAVAFAVGNIRQIFRRLARLLSGGTFSKKERRTRPSHSSRSTSIDEKSLEKRSIFRPSLDVNGDGPTSFLRKKNVRHRKENGWRETQERRKLGGATSMDLERDGNGS